ncbi:(2,3-dihydroxybenzoyl)adenylate synthase [Verrucosispora sp. WMMC514]|uniref:(2,3-dihydroxybenzoyl)adenylate synthase n=1 Tax=Verrucosispora sp. WMMC514 TaxID=3015156 RepID=UPI00248B6734|nr:(2,3-dihydroxybenzoyl)adenylate synthase [Verrucosispora sp. WMMC514]WBB94083.1 (2,3-dihydroxybenzoyl)adenylate synthase [Verrucosispora sp. WMMC514]
MLAGCVPWPPELARRYTERGYWRPEPLGTRLRTLARADADRVALVEPARRMTYGELDRRADRLAAGLRRAGLSPGDRVVVQLPNVIEFVTLCHALFRLGALPVFALPAHRESELAHLCAMSDATALVIPDSYLGFDHRELARRVAGPEHVFVVGEPAEFVALDTVDAEPEPLPAPDPADVALFLLSGGTTGLPKLIPRTHQDYGYNVRISAENAGLTAADSYLAVLPVGHNYALACPGVLGTLHVGGRVVLAPSPSVEDVFPLIERERVTVTGLVPPLALLWLEMAGVAGSDLSSLRLVQVGGAKFGADAARRFGPALGCAVQQSFGMAEGLLCQTALDDPPETVATTQGRPLSPDDEIRVVDASGAVVPDGEVGELLTRGPYTPRGYYQAEEHNATAFTADGFFRTGDLVRLLPSGHLVVEGRVKDQINRGGDKVAADEVEDHLLAHPAVRECAVVAMPDPLIGERTCAFVVPGPRGAAPRLAEMVAFLRDRGLAAYKLPDRLELVESFPRTAVGKVDKRRLRERIRELTGAQPGSTSAEGGR